MIVEPIDNAGAPTGAPAAHGPEPLLKASGIRKRFGAVQALRGVDFEVRAGEVMALLGDNGAGKSTLVKVLSGHHQPDEGELTFDGEPVELKTPHDSSALGIETVYQDLALCDNLDVVANMFLGREKHWMPGLLGPLREVSMEKRAREVLKSLGVRTLQDPRTKVSVLSGGQRQSVAIARATMWNSRIVMLDEPTAALGVEQTAQVLNLVRTLRENGHGVVLITHNMSDVFKVADRITVLRLGSTADVFTVKDTNPETVVSSITGGRALVGEMA
ncbi:ATP-binding cassette domain-containing protein [Microbacterium sp.]|jgi:D-xylose transport system ATP-binding protein|uniref:ATP-binding cassette domain-containing protein n=1 Tax=Microbacterium sp. TaxID=51671 RepID=UPI0037C95C17